MPQVFVSYARADKRGVTKLVAALKKLGFEPWWDDDILRALAGKKRSCAPSPPPRQ